MALTDLRIRAAKSESAAFSLRDGDGLYVVVKPSGAKIWRYDYRFLGRRLTLTIGRYPTITLQGARDARLRARRLVQEGVNPSAAKREDEAKARKIIGDTFRERGKAYLEQLRKQQMAQATIDKNGWVLDLSYPKLGHKPMREIKSKDVLEALREVEQSGRLETAKRMRTVIGSVFRMAILDDAAEYDPTYGLRKALRAPQTTHHPALIVPKEFGGVLRAIDGYGGSAPVRCGLQMLALTFVRPVELRFATWDEFDLEDSVWHIPAERMKMRRPHDVHLVAEARAVLRTMSRYTKRKKYVFPSPRDLQKPVSENTLNDALKSLGFAGRHTSHGFRSSASSILNERGFRDSVVELQLAHLDKNVVRRSYNRSLYWDERVNMMERWAGMLAEFRTLE